MPRKRWTLTQSEKPEYRKMAERLCAAGAGLDPSALGTTDSPWLTVKCSEIDSWVRASAHASVFVVYIRMVGLAPKTIIQGFDLSCPEYGLNAYILDDPTAGNSKQQLYVMLDESPFHRKQVVNHRVDAEGILRRGDVIEGLLLAQAFESVPIRYASGRCLPLCLSIMNQFDDVLELAFALPVERVTSPIHRRPGRAEGLFEPKEAPANGAVLHAAEVLVEKQRSASVKEQANGKSDCPARAAPDRPALTSQSSRHDQAPSGFLEGARRGGREAVGRCATGVTGSLDPQVVERREDGATETGRSR